MAAWRSFNQVNATRRTQRADLPNALITTLPVASALRAFFCVTISPGLIVTALPIASALWAFFCALRPVSFIAFGCHAQAGPTPQRGSIFFTPGLNRGPAHSEVRFLSL